MLLVFHVHTCLEKKRVLLTNQQCKTVFLERSGYFVVDGILPLYAFFAITIHICVNSHLICNSGSDFVV